MFYVIISIICKKVGLLMAVSYKKLWIMLIQKDMKKKDLIEQANISTYTLSKLNRNMNLTTDVLVKICKALNCNIGDIMDVINTETKEDLGNE